MEGFTPTPECGRVTCAGGGCGGVGRRWAVRMGAQGSVRGSRARELRRSGRGGGGGRSNPCTQRALLAAFPRVVLRDPDVRGAAAAGCTPGPKIEPRALQSALAPPTPHTRCEAAAAPADVDVVPARHPPAATSLPYPPAVTSDTRPACATPCLEPQSIRPTLPRGPRDTTRPVRDTERIAVCATTAAAPTPRGLEL